MKLYKNWKILKNQSDMKNKNNETAEIENIPRSNFTTTTKPEVNDRILGDKTKTSKISINTNNSNPDSELILVATDGSLTKSRSRISTATAVIFAENSILNEEFTTTAKKSSSEPEIIGALSALIKSSHSSLRKLSKQVIQHQLSHP